jgi:tripeptidyl-peptidase-1
MHITCDEYSVPAAVKAHVDFITPTIGLDAYLNAREPRKTRRAPKEAIESRQGLDSQGPDNSKPISGVQLGSFFPLPRPVGVGPTPQLTPQTGPLDNCHAAITPNCLRALYGIPVGSTDLYLVCPPFVQSNR